MSALPNIGDTTRAIEHARRIIARWSVGVPFVASDDEIASLHALISIAQTHAVSQQRKHRLRKENDRDDRDRRPTFATPQWMEAAK